MPRLVPARNLPPMTETLWREAPSPALRVWRGPPLRWEANAAALAWAAQAGEGAVSWPTLAERLVGGVGEDDGAWPGHPVALPDGVLLWIRPAAASNAAGPLGPDGLALWRQGAGVGTVWRHLHSGLARWDDHALRIIGRDPALGALPAGELARRVHRDDLARMRACEDRLLAGPCREDLRCRLVRDDGGVRQVRALQESRLAADGGVEVLSVLIDETEAVEHWLRRWEDESVIGRALAMAGVSLWEIDLAERRVHYNQHGFRILGIERRPEGVPLDAVRAAIHPEDRHLIEQAAQDAAQDGRLVDAVARYRDVAGHYKHLLTRRYGVRDDEGRVVALRGMSIDVSELVRERERSLSLLERMQMVAETIGVGFWWRDLDAGVFEWDEQMYRLHHRSPSEGPPSLDEWIARHVHPADRGWMAARQDAHYSKWTPSSDVVFRTVAPDGGERFIQSWTRRLVRHGHRVSLGIHVDITERRQAELRMEFERQRDQFAIEAAGIGVWERRASDGEPIYWSPTMYRLRGLAADDPRPPGEIVRASMQPEDDARAAHLLQRCIATGERFAYEFEVVWPDGTRRWLASTGRAVHDSVGKPVAVAGVNVDVTERRHVDQLARERDRAQQASEAKTQLMARVSHELRTPMNAVLGFADLMAHAEPPLPAAQAERLGRIRSAGTHLLGLIDDLLELSGADPGVRTMVIQPVALRGLLEDTLPWVATLAEDGRVQVGQPALADEAVLADRRRLGQVLTHLLTNGIKYNQPGGRVWLRLQAARLRDQPAWDLAVHDNGRGLSAEQLARLYEPFNRLGAEREGIPGAGMGLSIVHQLVHDMGGELTVDSAMGAGSRFVVRLPAAGASARPAAPTPDAPAAEPPPTTLRVLYIEDNPVNEMLVREMLALRPQVALQSAPDGGSGISRACHWRPDLVLLDLQLPDMTGTEVLRSLRAVPELAGSRFVALSANAMPQDVSQALADGFDEYWTKPLNLQRFLADIDALAAALG